MTKSTALQKLQSQKTNRVEQDRQPTKSEANKIKETHIENIMDMKVADLDYHHSTLEKPIIGWPDLDRTGKRQALLDSVNNPNNESETMDIDSDLEEDLEEVAEQPEEKKNIATKTGRISAKKSNKANKPKSKDIDEDNQLVTILNSIENMSEDEADLEVHRLKENVELTYFQLGGVLAVIKENKFIGEYSTFRDKVEAEFGMKYRKADYLINIYLNIVDSGVDWGILKGIGWTKLKVIAHLLTPENAEEWSEKAREMNVSTLESEVKQLKKSGEINPSRVAKSEISSMTFKLHPDQREIIDEAIDKAKEESDTDVKTVVLEAIFLDYLAGGTKQVIVKQPTVKQFFKQIMKENDDDVEASLSCILEGEEFESVFGTPINGIDFEED